MDYRQQQVSSFFDKYEADFNHGISGADINLAEAQKGFTDCFIGANPNGVACGKNENQFREAISQGYQFYKNIGITAMNIVSKEVTPLDDFHVMARIRWKAEFVRKDSTKGGIEFDNIYFLQTIASDCKIFCYITGDEQKVLRERGLI